MLVRKYQNLTEMFMELNREIISKPSQMLDYVHGILGYIDNVVLASKSCDFDFDLSKVGYKVGKWSHLLRTYVDYEELIEFHKKLEDSTALSLTYYFKQKKANNGSCLIAIVVSRNDRKKKWTKVNVLYRTTEVQRRFAADLTLVQSFIKELPSCCEINRIIFYFPQMYISAKVLNGYFNLFGIPMESLDKSNEWVKTMIRDYELNYVPGSRITTYQSIARMQKLRLGLTKYDPLLSKSLSIRKYFESKKEK